MVGTYFDPATRYQGAVIAAKLLPASRLLSYAGWGHVAAYLRGSYCVDSAVTRYLVTTAVAAAGTVCAPAGSPFGPEDAATRAAATARSAVTGGLLPPAARRALAPG